MSTSSSSEPTRAVYVRLPDRLAHKLDRAAQRLGVSKREVLATLVDDHLDLDGDTLVLRPRGGRAGAVADAEVLTLEEAAELLRVPTADVLTLIESGDLPARRVGQQWRLTRSGLLDWLRGDGPDGLPAGRP